MKTKLTGKIYFRINICSWTEQNLYSLVTMAFAHVLSFTENVFFKLLIWVRRVRSERKLIYYSWPE